ncbi:lamina-associated polypeptide 2, isoforms alpha/zeta-like [Ranitomeya variabilis]|uniref:lamina-associated polypeptide 2, isoforms alpha/zeta-like n=1 Tax=Ranitomeya variabilis TaxID=490064 RepID=UPI0040573816
MSSPGAMDPTTGVPVPPAKDHARGSSDTARKSDGSRTGSRPSDPSKKRQKTKHRECALCNQPLPDSYPKKLCEDCFKETTQGAAVSITDLRAIIREELKNMTQEKPRSSKSKTPTLVSDSDSDQPILSDASLSSCPASSSSSEIEGRSCFPLDSVDNLVKSIRNTMGCEESKGAQTAQEIMFAGLADRKRRCFPVIPAVKTLIKREWEKQDQRGFLPSASKRKYPFSDEELLTWTKVPKVDAAVASTSKQSTLPVEDAGLLVDPLDRKAESSLKRSWEAATGIFKPAVASTCAARSMIIWIDQLDQQIEKKSSREKLRAAIPLIRGAAAFLADASADSLRLAARSAGLVNNARRALWMKSWKGDAQSKSKICAIPCEGEYLFGKTLDDILKKAKDRKKAFPESSIPFYRRAFKRRPFGKRRQTDRSTTWTPKDDKQRGTMFRRPNPPKDNKY